MSAFDLDPTREAVALPRRASARLALVDFARVSVPLGFLLALALLMLQSPYRGIRHDAILYAGQALHLLDPHWAANDVFFRYGSQDQFTLFTNVFARLIAAFGLPGPSFVLLVLGRALFLWATWQLTWEWAPARRWLALLAVAGLAHFFGSGRMFALLEPFLTARTFAQPFALFALVALIRGRLLLAIACLVVAMLAHPLFAIPAAMAGWFYLIGRDRRWAWAALALLFVGGLAWSGISPFDRLRQTYDEQWYAVSTVVNDSVFVSLWTGRDLTANLGKALLLWLAIRGRGDAVARLSRAVIASVAVLLIVSFVGADLMRNVLITQLQLWRGLWMVELLFVVWVPTLVLDYWSKGPLGRMVAVNLVMITQVLSEYFPNEWALLAWVLALMWLCSRRTALSRTIMILLWIATGGVIFGVVWQIVFGDLYQIADDIRGTALSHDWSVPFVFILWTVPACAVLLAWSAHAPRRAAAVTIAIFVAAFAQFDQRTPYSRLVEASLGQPHPFDAFIPPQATVFWENLDTPSAWFMLHRASYLGGGEFSGAVLDKGLAAELRNLWPQLILVQKQFDQCTALQGFTQDRSIHFEACRMSQSDFVKICRGSDEHPDFMVTTFPYSLRPVSQWVFDPHDGSEPITYFLHDCNAMRAQAASPVGK